MNNIFSENFDTQNTDFSSLKKHSFLSNPNILKKAALRNAEGSSFCIESDLSKTFFLTSFELAYRFSI